MIDLVGGMGAWAACGPNGGTGAPLRPPLEAEQKDRLVVWTHEPLNAETPLELLCRSTVTPTELFFVRTHGSVPEVDELTPAETRFLSTLSSCCTKSAAYAKACVVALPDA